MLHWPDNMVTYDADDKILFSNDAFGQHIASAERYDSEIAWPAARVEAQKYYANILMPFSSQVQKTLPVISSLPIEIICPSHGIIWKKFIPEILKEYGRWSDGAGEAKAPEIIENLMKEIGWEIPEKNVNINFVPDEDELKTLQNTGSNLGEMLKCGLE